MTPVALVVVAAALTFASRAIFLVRPTATAPQGLWARFLDVFPLALFMSLATVGLAAPDGHVTATPTLAAAAGGVVGALVTRRSLLGVLVFGTAAYWLARLLAG